MGPEGVTRMTFKIGRLFQKLTNLYCRWNRCHNVADIGGFPNYYDYNGKR